MRNRVKNHGFLRHFYASYLPYTAEFEQMYNIIEEKFRKTDNAIVLGWTFNTLKEYHQAAQRDLEEIYMENARVENEPLILQEPVIISIDLLGDEYKNLPVEDQNMLVRELAKDYMKDYQSFFLPSYEVCDVIWREEAQRKRMHHRPANESHGNWTIRNGRKCGTRNPRTIRACLRKNCRRFGLKSLETP